MYTNFLSVDTCTELLPEHKPRYVMGVVRIHLRSRHSLSLTRC